MILEEEKMSKYGILKEKTLQLGILWLRIFMGTGIAYHGLSKIFGGRMEGMIGAIANMGFPLPSFFAWAAALSESIGGILIILGLGTRIAALFIFITMSVAAFIVHGSDPFKIKELALTYGVMAITLILMGGGHFSLDSFICKHYCKKANTEKGDH